MAGSFVGQYGYCFANHAEFHHPEKFKSEQITAWYDAYLQRHLPGEVNSDTRSSLLSHLNALIVNGVQLQNYNDKIVAETRDILLTMPLSDLAYQKVKNELIKSAVKPVLN